MSEPIFMFDAQDAEMQKACQDARTTFRFFWRELAWEARRIVPGLDLAIVKLPFTDGPRTDGNSANEHMWIEGVSFDGDTISGTLLNAPNWLTSVCKGDAVSVPAAHLTDWMFTSQGRAYGGFTVNLMRSQMGRGERAQHDQAWGLDFGDPTDIRVEMSQKPQPKAGWLSRLMGKGAQASLPPEGFNDHPMCVNMLPKIQAQLQADPSAAKSMMGEGWSLLHHEALAGNLGVVKLLIEYGADPAARTPKGDTAADLARKTGWVEIADFLEA